MVDFTSHLAQLPAAAIDVVIHVGAGECVELDAYRALGPRRLLLVEGDPDTAQALSEAVLGIAAAEVHATAVAAQAGPLPWNRYNLPALNGPVEAAALASFYPRLRRIGSTQAEAQAFTDFLDRSLGQDDASERTLLVMDVPGQVADLLATLDADPRRRIGWLLLRTPRDSGLPGNDAGLADWLEQRHYRPLASEDDALWQTRLYRHDRDAAERAEQRARLAALEEALSAARSEASGAQAQVAELQRIITQRESRIAALSAQLDHEQQARMASETALQEAHVQIETLARAHDEAVKRAAEHAQARKSEAEQQLLSGAETQAKALEAQTRLATERAGKVAALTRELEAATRELADERTRNQAIRIELEKADAQLGLLKDLLREGVA